MFYNKKIRELSMTIELLKIKIEYLTEFCIIGKAKLCNSFQREMDYLSKRIDELEKNK